MLFFTLLLRILRAFVAIVGGPDLCFHPPEGSKKRVAFDLHDRKRDRKRERKRETERERERG
jgi:hypothetical protein